MNVGVLVQGLEADNWCLAPVDGGDQLLEPLPGEFGLAGEAGLSGESGLAGEAGLGGESGLTGEAGLCTLTGLAGEMGLAGDGGLSGESGLAGDAGLGGDGGLSGESGLAGDGGLSGESGLSGDPGESMSRVDGDGSTTMEVVGTGEGAEACVVGGTVGRTEAAEASCAAVVGTTTGADRRGTLVSSWRNTPSGVRVSESGAASTKPPTATPVIVPTVAASFQLSLRVLGIMSVSCEVRMD